MRLSRLYLLMAALALPFGMRAQTFDDARRDSTVQALIKAGFVNVRAVETTDYLVYSLENDYYKIPAEGFSRAVRILDDAGLPTDKPLKLIGLNEDIPELTITYRPENQTWFTTKYLDSSWKAVRGEKRQNSSFGKVSIDIYPQVSLMNLIITQVYQSLWQLSPALEVSLWKGAHFTYQVKIPVYNDGYGPNEGRVHPGMISLSQRFRDPWHLNVLGKATVGTFSNGRYGAALEMAYYFPNERFWVDTQLGLLANYYFKGFTFHYSSRPHFRWNVAANYYMPSLQTQFILRAQKFLMGDIGLKAEMIRHFRHCSIGFYAEKGFDAPTNGGFRFQVALPAFRMKRYGYWPRVNTSGQMGISYNAGNERYFYKDFRTEAADNIMKSNYYNPYYVNRAINSGW